jgi:hypothetical protein
MSEGKLADILNENPGVVTAGVGLAIKRDLGLTNQNIARLTHELASLQRHLAQEQASRQAQAALRDKLYHIFCCVDDYRTDENDTVALLRLESLAKQLEQLDLSTAHFDSLEDKSLLTKTQKRLSEACETIRRRIPPETADKLSELKRWWHFNTRAEMLLQIEASISSKTKRLNGENYELSCLLDSQHHKNSPEHEANSYHLIVAIMLSIIGAAVFVALGNQWAIVGLLCMFAVFFLVTRLVMHWAKPNKDRQQQMQLCKDAIRGVQKGLSLLEVGRERLVQEMCAIAALPGSSVALLSDLSASLNKRTTAINGNKQTEEALRTSLAIPVDLASQLRSEIKRQSSQLAGI